MAEAEAINFGRVDGPEFDSNVALFHRRIEFHVARKPFSGFVNNNSNGFKLVTLNPNPEPHKTSGPVKKCEKSSEFSETLLDPELSFEITFRRIGAGLRNLGNTCFLNSVLQCLTYTEPLAAYLQSGKHLNSCRNSGFCALCAIQKHVNRALQATGRSLEPKDLVSNLRCISRNFRNARQEDAHEYMVNLLESMHKCCLPSGVPSESPGAYEKSLVHKIFGGRLRSQVKCMQCSDCSDKFDPFLDLSIEIAKADSLLKALAHFTAKEQLDGGAKQYHCQQCKQKVKALKQLTIHKAPRVLTVHLKRFSSHAPGIKVDKKIAFGPTLDLKPFVTGPYDGEDVKYTLYGVLVHAGWSTHSGHYYCFVRTSNGMWYSLDDNQVFQVNERKVLEQKAYMLFYVRDMKKSVTRKPVNVIAKENMVMNAIGNAAYSKVNLELREKIQNGTIENKIDGSSSSALSEKDAQKETPNKKIPFQNRNDAILVDSVGHKRRTESEHSSVVPPSKGTLEEPAARNIISVVDDRGGSHLPSGDSVDTLDLSDAAKNISGNNRLSVVEDRNASGVDCMVPEDFVDKKESTATSSGGLCKMEMCDNKIMPMEMVAEASDKVNILRSSQQNGSGESQVGGSSDDPTFEGNHGSWQKMKAIQPGLLSGPPAITQHSEIKKRPELKLKRYLFKYQVPTMSLSSNIIFGVGRKKKLKRKKDPKKSRKFKHVSSGSDLHDVGPSISDELLPSLNCSPSQEKKAKCVLNDKLNNISGEGNVASEIIKNEFRARVVDGTTLFAEAQPRKSQSDLMSMLTRGLEETTVARWDGIDVSLPEKLETRIVGTAQIGYVGDEWDDEYDRGKRKKVRTSKVSFDGPNLFQQVATENSKRKRAKLNRVENQPFRI